MQSVEEIVARKKAHYLSNRDEVLARQKKYYAEHRQERLAYYHIHKVEIAAKKKIYQEHRLVERNRRRSPQDYLFTHYGITFEDYEQLLLDHDGKCAICKRDDRKLCIDHDHETGKIRGLLCNNCNTALGLLHDSQDALLAAIEYLISKKHECGLRAEVNDE